MSQGPLQRGLLVVLSAPSGAGKTTLARRLVDEVPGAIFSVSVTTREPRGQERNGVDYQFVSAMQFQERIERGEFLEWAEVHGHFYGSPRAPVDRALASGGVAVFDIDVQGGRTIQRKNPEAILVFVVPPSLEELERRLRERGTETEESIGRRLLAARAEIEHGVATYDYIVVNDQVGRAFGDLTAIVSAERCRRGRADLSKLGGKLGEPVRGNVDGSDADR